MKKAFMDEDFLLHSDTAKALYHGYAKDLPIIDYHCHISPKEIYEDKVFSDLSEVWLSGDHYKWRVMRANGVPEDYVTGSKSPQEKFAMWAKTLPRLIGNPLYHWTHLELQRHFGITEPLNEATFEDIWEKAHQMLPRLSAREIIRRSRVEALCTTDDPKDDLRWHRLMRDDPTMPCKVYPAFRPDKALGVEKPGFIDYIKELSEVCGMDIKTLDDLKAALRDRLAVFINLGCRAADHGLDEVAFEPGKDADGIFQKALRCEGINKAETDAYRTELLCFLAREYRENDIVMQLHFGVVRNSNPAAFKRLGPDTGYDAIRGQSGTGAALAGLLGEMESHGGLPKTILYSLNPTDNAQLAALTGCFQDGSYPGKIQHGSAWWFNDSKQGMLDHLNNLASHTVFANFIGMLTDSRSLLSYTRHEYFRRILCQWVADQVDRGEYPEDEAFLGKMVQDICYYNSKRYFNLDD